jgi:hypothetical protein
LLERWLQHWLEHLLGSWVDQLFYDIVGEDAPICF